MDFRQDGDNLGTGGGGLATGLAMGSMMNRRDNDRAEYIWAVIIFAIIFIIALVFLAAFMRRDDGRKDGVGTDLAAIIAAKSLDCNNGHKNGEIDKFEIMQKIEHSEDRARETQTQQEIGSVKSELGAVALMMQKMACDNEKENLKEFGEIKSQLSAQSMVLMQLSQKSNNQDIINGVIQQLMYGKPCVA